MARLDLLDEIESAINDQVEFRRHIGTALFNALYESALPDGEGSIIIKIPDSEPGHVLWDRIRFCRALKALTTE